MSEEDSIGRSNAVTTLRNSDSNRFTDVTSINTRQSPGSIDHERV